MKMKDKAIEELNEELKTALGKVVPKDTKGVLYLCNYEREIPKITVVAEKCFNNQLDALDAYANTRNPESQLAMGKDFETLSKSLIRLHEDMKNDVWLEMLGDSI